jgi:hypothetical protein
VKNMTYIEDPQETCSVCAGYTVRRSDNKRLTTDARALWAVRVLDAWRTANTRRQHVERSWDEAGTSWEVELYFERNGSNQFHHGATPAAARLAAAEAVYPTLPADVRATLGERP